MLVIVVWFVMPLGSHAQEKVVLPPKYKVDTKIDNMGYWRKMAELGLVTVQPPVNVPPAKYIDSRVVSKGVLIDDSPDVPVTELASTQSENSIAVDPNDKAVLLNSNNSGSYPNTSSIYGANYFESEDMGATWSGQLQGAGGGNSGDPAAVINLDGRYFIGYIDNGYGQSVSYSNNQGANWSVVKVANGSMFNMLDKNHLWVDISPVSPYKGNLYNGWMYNNQIYVSRSNTNGTSWSTSVSISNACNAGSHNQGINFKCGPDGEAYAAWAVYDGWPADEKAVGFARSLDGGTTWQTASRIINNIRGTRTSGVGKNMRTNSFPCMAVDLGSGPTRGNIYVVWANLGVPGTNTGASDIYMIKSTDKGLTWSSPKKINTDVSTTKQQYMPWITVDNSTGNLFVVFYDDRNCGANDLEAWMAYSEDAGETWQDMRVSDVSFTPSPIPGLADGYMGDYLAIAAADGWVYPAWTDTRSGHAMTYVSPIQFVVPSSNLMQDGYVLNDTTFGNSNNKMDFNETELLGVKVKNLGNVDAENVEATLRCTSSYITITDSTESYGTIAMNESKLVRDAFKFDVAINTPDALDIPFDLKTVDAAGKETITTFTIRSYAPAPKIMSVSILDASGNGNGQLDPGENVTMRIITKNTGSYTAVNTLSELSCSNPFLTIANPSQTLGNLEPGQTVNVDFAVSVNSAAYHGMAALFVNYVHSEYHSDTKNILQKLGILVEDWETGDLSKFEWQLYGDSDWYIDNTVKYEGNYSLHSGAITHSQLTGLKLDYNVLVDDSISFFRKVNSEAFYDNLKFYIDDLMVGKWAGKQDWKRFAYPVLAGNHTFRWEYEKDAQNTTGLDAAWVDYIVLPAEMRLAASAGNDAATCEQLPYTCAGIAFNADSSLWRSNGSGVFADAHAANTTYTPSIADVEAGSVLLSFTSYGFNGSETTDTLVLSISKVATASAGNDAAICAGTSYTLAEASSSSNVVVTWSTTGDGSFNDIHALNPVYTPGSQDVATGNVSLSILPSSQAPCESNGDVMQLTIHALPVVNLGADTSICSYLSVALDGTTANAVSYLWSPTGTTLPLLSVDSVGVGVGNKTLTLTVTDQNNCQSSDAIVVNFKDCTGIGEPTIASHVQLYPNPVKETLFVRLTGVGSSMFNLRILNAAGQDVQSIGTLNLQGSADTKIDVSQLANGTYLLELSRGTEKQLLRFVISK
mgnify:CR=1 FL=1